MNIELTDYEAKLLIDVINIALSLNPSWLALHNKTLLDIGSKLYKECRDTREPLSCTEFVNKITNGELK